MTGDNNGATSLRLTVFPQPTDSFANILQLIL